VLLKRPLRSTEGEEEGRARAGNAVGPHLAAVPLDDAPHDAQTDAAAVVCAAVQPMERLEQGAGGSRLEADAVVAHEQDPPHDVRTDIDLDTWIGLMAGVGHDWWISDRWSVGILARLAYANMHVTGGPHVYYAGGTPTERDTVISPTLEASFTWH